MTTEANLWDKAPKDKLWITQVGSLPHHNVDSALEYSFRHPIPFVPQLPAGKPKEFMISQALDGLPGMRSLEDGFVSMDLTTWSHRASRFSESLESAFSNDSKPDAFEDFLPKHDSFHAWKPFVWECIERKVPFAKIQIAGPMTCQWAIKIDDGSAPEKRPLLTSQIFRLVLARSIAMVRRFKQNDIQPLLVLDEPGLYTFSSKNPTHLLALKELSVVISTLKKEGALVGLHCCSDTSWPEILSLPLDLLAIDADLSLSPLMESKKEVKAFLETGRFCLGVIPTSKSEEDLREFDSQKTLDTLISETDFSRDILRHSLYSPACGLGMLNIPQAEMVFERLMEFQSHLNAFLEKDVSS